MFQILIFDLVSLLRSHPSNFRNQTVIEIYHYCNQIFIDFIGISNLGYHLFHCFLMMNELLFHLLCYVKSLNQNFKLYFDFIDYQSI
jgi:hypothetical protein